MGAAGWELLPWTPPCSRFTRREGKRAVKGHPLCASWRQIAHIWVWWVPGAARLGRTHFLLLNGMEKEWTKPRAGIQDDPPSPAAPGLGRVSPQQGQAPGGGGRGDARGMLCPSGG